MKRIFSHIGFSAAVTLLAVNLIELKYVYIITAVLTALFAVSLAVSKTAQALTVPVCFGSALFACLLFLCVYNSAVLPAIGIAGKEGNVSFYLTELPDYTNGRYVYIAKTASVLIDGAPQTVKVRITSNAPIIADYYTLINAKASFYSIGSSAFDSYGRWSDSIFIGAEITDYTVTTQSVFNPLKYILLLRNDIIETFVNSVKTDGGAVSAALVTGDKYYLSEDIKQTFRLAGASHILAVSGLHLSVITGSLLFILKRIGTNRKAVSVILIVFSLLYMALAGFSGSVTRAGIMVIVLFSAELFNRKADSLNSLGFAAFIMCLNPFAVTDSGTVLSTLSVLSLITLYPYLKSRFKGVYEWLNDKRKPALKPFKALIEAVLKSVLIAFSVFLVTLPACCVFFNYSTLCGLFSNIFIVPVGSAATVLSFIGYPFLRFKIFSGLTALILGKVNYVLIALVGAVSKLKILIVPLSSYFYYVIAGVLLILAVNFIVFHNKAFKTAFRLSAAIIVISLAINVIWQYNNANVLITESGAVTAISDGRAVVSGVKNSFDYNEVKNYLVMHRCELYVVINSEKSAYSDLLFEEFGAKRNVSNSYYADITDDFKVNFSDGTVQYTLKDVTLSAGFKSGEISVLNGTVCDRYGTADLSRGSLVYSINNNYYTAGRC